MRSVFIVVILMLVAPAYAKSGVVADFALEGAYTPLFEHRTLNDVDKIRNGGSFVASVFLGARVHRNVSIGGGYVQWLTLPRPVDSDTFRFAADPFVLRINGPGSARREPAAVAFGFGFSVLPTTGPRAIEGLSYVGLHTRVGAVIPFWRGLGVAFSLDVEYFPEQPPLDDPFPRTVILTAGGGLSWSAR